MSFTVSFPYETGTFVKISNPEFERKKDNSRYKDQIGTIACYNCVTGKEDGYGEQYTVVVSGYKEAWCGEYLLHELTILTQDEIDSVKRKYESEIGGAGNA